MIEEELKQMDKKELLGVIKAQKYEIKNKDKVINGMIENEEKYNFEIIKLKSIIKEVREYIEHYENIRGYYEYEENGYDEYNYEEDLKQELLEILDKENKND